MLNESKDSCALNLNYYSSGKNEHYLFSHKYNLYQQFFIVGLEPKLMYNINNVELTEYPPEMLEPKIISKFPNKTLTYLNIPDYIIASHCFPNGLKNLILKEDNDNQELNKDFVFTLENRGYEDKESSLRTHKVYYTCFLFYESIEDYRNLVNLRNMRKKETKIEIKNNGLLIPKVICFSSFNRLYNQTTQILHGLKEFVDQYNYTKISDENINYFTIEKIIEGLIFYIPGLPRSNYCIKLNDDTFRFENEEVISRQDTKKSTNSKSSTSERCVTETDEPKTKEIIFKTTPPNKLPLPITDFSKLMLFFQIDEIYDIIKWITLEAPILFFCDNISDLTYTIEGLVSLIYPFDYPYPVISVLPEENYPLIPIFKHFIFGINYKYSKEIFDKKNINIETKKLLVIVRIEKRFENPVNFREKSKSNLPVVITIKSDPEKPILKMDQLISYYSESNQREIKKKEVKKITLPIHYKEKTRKKFIDSVDLRVKETLNKQKKKKLNKNELEKIISEELSDCMLNFFVNIFSHYQDYCLKSIKKKDSQNEYEKDDILEQKYNENKISINDLFNCDGFVNSVPQLDKNYYAHFLKTKIFYYFMKKKIFPLSTQDKLDVLFFDEKINEKLNAGTKKNYSSFFLKNEFNSLRENIYLTTFRRNISREFREFCLIQKNSANSFNYFQIFKRIESKNRNTKPASLNITQEEYDSSQIDMNSTINDEDYDRISFHYFVFPKLLNDGIFYKGDQIEECFWSPGKNYFTSTNSDCLFRQLDRVCKPILNNDEILQRYSSLNYSFNLVSLFNVRMKDYIHILWLQYFAKTFYLTPLSERKRQFEKMMIVLKTLQNVDKNTFNILFNTINKYGDRDMNQDLFINLKNKTYISFLCLREKTKPQNNFMEFIIDKEEEKNVNDNKCIMTFDENSFCSNKTCREIYNVQMKFLTNNSINYHDTYIKFKCDKCKTEQNIQVNSIYDNGLGNTSKINFRLISPLALLKKQWFQDKSDLNLFIICKEHLESYMSAMFYFSLQGVFCGFMIPQKKKEAKLEISKINRDSEKKENIKTEKQTKKNDKTDEKNKISKKINSKRSDKNKNSRNYKTSNLSRNYKTDIKGTNSIEGGRGVIDLDSSADGRKFFELSSSNSVSELKIKTFNKKKNMISTKNKKITSTKVGTLTGQLSARNLLNRRLVHNNSENYFKFYKPKKK